MSNSAFSNPVSPLPGGALIKVGEIVTSGSQTSVVFSGISGTYRNLRVSYQARCATVGKDDNLAMTINGVVAMCN